MTTQISGQEAAKNYFESGEVLRGQGQIAEAIQQYKLAVETYPQHLDGLCQLADIYAEAEKFESAIECYRKALELQPNSAGIHIKLAKALASTHQLQESVTEFRKAIDLKPDVGFDVYLGLIDILKRQNDFKQARSFCRQYLEIDPSSPKARLCLGDLCFYQKSIDQSLTHYQRFLKGNPEGAVVYFRHILSLGLANREDQEFREQFIAAHPTLMSLLQDNVQYQSSSINVYHCCAPRTASQWLKKILVDFRIYQYSGLAPIPVGLVETPGKVPPQTLQTGTFPISYEAFCQMPKPETYKAFFVIRDPRDLVVSSYFANRYSHVVSQSTLKNRQVLSDLAVEDGILYMIDALQGLFQALQSWVDAKKLGESELAHQVKLIRYEDLTGENQLETFTDLFQHCDIAIPESVLSQLLEDNKFKKLSGGRKQGEENHMSHYRKGVSGDWKNYFSEPIQQKFAQAVGDLVQELGYL
ncbi:MAG: tetratricopeptide repeat protein [Microcoleaceae cyanobacterium]